MFVQGINSSTTFFREVACFLTTKANLWAFKSQLSGLYLLVGKLSGSGTKGQLTSLISTQEMKAQQRFCSIDKTNIHS